MVNEANGTRRDVQTGFRPVLFYNEVVIDHFMNP
jgi:hypothetical protein